jgi:murein DD-endopeptidase MepM/ murein hydrolase activator NlpD
MPFALRSLLFLFAVIFAISNQLSAQKAYPKDYFRSPMDIRLLLSGTFGEIRSNHFHSGIDIKTGGVEGKAVYAIADGYVSRIKVSAYGFGKVFYVNHPNGFVSVYAHLSRFNKATDDYVRKEQYRRESFEIELFPSENELPVKKGDVIAYSGNSGSSGGPHLHFEIREGATQKPVNPLLFGYEVKDFTRPKISSIKIYPEGDDASLNGSHKPARYLAEGWGLEHRLANNPLIRLSGNISFAIQVHDQQNDTDNKNGPYSISLFIDSVEVYYVRMETFSFDETRYVNSYLDYAEYVRNNIRLQRTRIDPGNKLSIYGNVLNKGVFQFRDTLVHTIRYEVKDVAGNISSLTFQVRSEKNAIALPASLSGNKDLPANSKSQTADFNYATSNHFSTGSVILEAPTGVFYDSFIFKYDSVSRIAGTYSAVHRIHENTTPVHDFITLSIKPSGLPAKLRDKSLLVKIKTDGKSFSSAGGKWEQDGFVRAKIREFGSYSVAVDTIPPKINPLQKETFTNLAVQKYVKFSISDELSGIASYRGTLNGKWILMDYDAKNNLLVYTIDDQLLKGENIIRLEVVDMKNNRKTYETKLVR